MEINVIDDELDYVEVSSEKLDALPSTCFSLRGVPLFRRIPMKQVKY